MAGPDRQAFYAILKSVSRRIRQDSEIDDLGMALDIGWYDIQCSKVGNRHGSSYMGTLDLLRDWMHRHQQEPSTMIQTLRDALREIGRYDIIDLFLPEFSADSSGQHGAVGPSQSPTPSDDSSGQHGAVGPSQSLTPPDDSSGQHGAVGPSQSLTPPDDGWQNRTVKPATPSPNVLDDYMQYDMWESLVKGNALVIGNADFPRQEQRRPWAEIDIKNMKRLLEDLGYDFRNNENIYRNLSKSEMEEAVQLFTDQLEKDKPQSAVVYISSHGNETGIEGSDRNILPIPVLMEKLSKVLLGKPKVLIIDACWGGGETRRLPISVSNCSSGAQTTAGLPENADIFMIHSTSYGKQAWSDPNNGSWFVTQLSEVVYDSRDLEDLDTIMLRVTKGMRTMTASRDGKTYNGTQSTTVLKQGVDKKLFFYPGFPSSNV